MKINRRPWKRNQQTTDLVSAIRAAAAANAGIVEETAIVPLLNTYSVVGMRSDGRMYNARLKKEDLSVATVELLEPIVRKGLVVHIRRIPA